ncbi:hypothetical protein [Polymorphospora sp. NPDC050346]|uniref:hypothetical protein n=1 Tax=Polymorphospora sp. NPDC050346 TaxID=3155780 RepID=UPI0034005701
MSTALVTTYVHVGPETKVVLSKHLQVGQIGLRVGYGAGELTLFLDGEGVDRVIAALSEGRDLLSASVAKAAV